MDEKNPRELAKAILDSTDLVCRVILRMDANLSEMSVLYSGAESINCSGFTSATVLVHYRSGAHPGSQWMETEIRRGGLYPLAIDEAAHALLSRMQIQQS